MSITSSPFSSPHSSLHSLPALAGDLRSITKTYYLAHAARNKLAYEASRADHRLSRLVGHANLLDSLMIRLSRADEEQIRYQQLYLAAQKSMEESRSAQHIQWADCVVEEPEEDWQSSDADSSDSDSDYDSDEETEMEADMVSLRRVPPHKILPVMQYPDDGDDDYEVVESPHHSYSTQLPELDNDSDSSEDDLMPPTPTTIMLPTLQTQPAKTDCADSDPPTSVIPLSEQQAFFDEGFYLPPRTGDDLTSTLRVCG